LRDISATGFRKQLRETRMRLSRKRCYVTATGIQFNQASDTHWGGAVGTGYDHLFMGSPNVVCPASAIAVTRSDNIRQDVDIGTVRVNYRFGGPVVAKY